MGQQLRRCWPNVRDGRIYLSPTTLEEENISSSLSQQVRRVSAGTFVSMPPLLSNNLKIGSPALYFPRRRRFTGSISEMIDRAMGNKFQPKKKKSSPSLSLIWGRSLLLSLRSYLWPWAAYDASSSGFFIVRWPPPPPAAAHAYYRQYIRGKSSSPPPPRRRIIMKCLILWLLYSCPPGSYLRSTGF